MFRVANLRVPEWNRAPVRCPRRSMLKLCAVGLFASFLGLSSGGGGREIEVFGLSAADIASAHCKRTA
jgi:hypothetical protein